LRLILKLAWHCCADPSNAQKAYGQKEIESTAFDNLLLLKDVGRITG